MIQISEETLRSKNKMTPLLRWAVQNKENGFIYQLRESGFDLTTKSFILLKYALKYENLDLAEQLLKDYEVSVDAAKAVAALAGASKNLDICQAVYDASDQESKEKMILSLLVVGSSEILKILDPKPKHFTTAGLQNFIETATQYSEPTDLFREVIDELIDRNHTKALEALKSAVVRSCSNQSAEILSFLRQYEDRFLSSENQPLLTYFYQVKRQRHSFDKQTLQELLKFKHLDLSALLEDYLVYFETVSDLHVILENLSSEDKRRIGFDDPESHLVDLFQRNTRLQDVFLEILKDPDFNVSRIQESSLIEILAEYLWRENNSDHNTLSLSEEILEVYVSRGGRISNEIVSNKTLKTALGSEVNEWLYNITQIEEQTQLRQDVARRVAKFPEMAAFVLENQVSEEELLELMKEKTSSQPKRRL